MSQINVNTITGKDGGSAVNFPHGITVTGVVTATQLNQNVTGNITASGTVTGGAFSGPLTGNVTGTASLASNLTGTPNITVGTITGTDATLSGNLTVQGTQTVIDTATLSVEDKNIGIGSVTTPTNTTANHGGLTIFGGADGDKSFTWNLSGVQNYWQVAGGQLYAAEGLNAYGMLSEKVKILGNDLGSVSTIDLVDGMVHMRTPNLGANVRPNVRYSATKTLGSSMSVGEGISVTIIHSVNNSSYKVTGLDIDGVTQTVSWIGGSAPSDGGSATVDIYTFNIIKYGTGTTDYTIIGNQTKTS